MRKKKRGLRKSKRERNDCSGRARKSHERRKSSGGAKKKREVEAQEGHDGEEEMTTQEKCVEAKKEANSMHEENDVSNRHMTWGKNAWWIRVDSGPHLWTARGRRRIWPAARRAAEQARDDDRVEETRSRAEEAERET